MRTLFRKSDLFLLLSLLFTVFLLLLILIKPKQSACAAVIEQNGTLVREVDLSTLKATETLTLHGDFQIRLLLEPDGVSFLSSECPDQTCVRTGKLTRPGQSAVCLPARVSVYLKGSSQTQDAITG